MNFDMLPQASSLMPQVCSYSSTSKKMIEVSDEKTFRFKYQKINIRLVQMNWVRKKTGLFLPGWWLSKPIMAKRSGSLPEMVQSNYICSILALVEENGVNSCLVLTMRE
jgi:hypothetical protein